MSLWGPMSILWQLTSKRASNDYLGETEGNQGWKQEGELRSYCSNPDEKWWLGQHSSHNEVMRNGESLGYVLKVY